MSEKWTRGCDGRKREYERREEEEKSARFTPTRPLSLHMAGSKMEHVRTKRQRLELKNLRLGK